MDIGTDDNNERNDCAKDVIKKRHKLIITILSGLVLILLSIIITLAVSYRRSSNYAQEICSTSACLRAVSSDVLSGNTCVNPCDDFWSFSCEGWITSNPLPYKRGYYSVRDQLERRIRHDIRQYILNIPQNIDNTYFENNLLDKKLSQIPEWKVRMFYESCMNLPVAFGLDSRIRRDLLSFESNPYFEYSLGEFANYGVNVFFSISVDTDDHTGRSIIKIDPSGLGLPLPEYYTNYSLPYNDSANEYKRLLFDVFLSIGFNSTIAFNLSNIIYSFEQSLAEIMPTLQQRQSPKKYTRMQVRDLNRDMPYLNWTQLFQTIYKAANVNEATYILVAYTNYFKRLDLLLSSKDKQVIENYYFFWRVVYTYLPYLSQRSSQLYNEFVWKISGANNDGLIVDSERWEFCIRTTTKFFGEAVGAVYVKNRMESEAIAVNDVYKMIEIMSETLLENLENWKNSYNWIIGDKSLETVRRKVREMSRSSRIVIGHSQFVSDMNSVEAYYSNYAVTKNFFDNVRQGFTIMRKIEERRLFTSNSSVTYSLNIIPTDVKALYKVDGNQLFIASGLLRYPFYEHDIPVAMKFGALGFQIASQMLRVISSEALAYDSQGKLVESPMDKSTLETAVNQCLKDDINNYQSKQETDFHVNATLTVAQSLADIVGLQLLYESYKKYSMKYGEDGLVPGLSRSNDELFFISLAQSMCETVRPEYARPKYKYMTTLPAKQRIGLMFRQLKQFQYTFKCEEGRNMCSLGLN